MDYPFQQIEDKWRKKWKESKVYEASLDHSKPKYYVLDMFPYPSGSGLHVGHPLGYVASDIISRHKRHQGYNVLHPMGFDAFGLPAEQYAIQTGRHPQDTTNENIQRFKDQLDNIGFCYDWSRELKTSDPAYYKFTQWIFQQLYQAWYDESSQKAMPMEELRKQLDEKGNKGLAAACNEHTPLVSREEWKAMSEAEQSLFLQNYRLAYLGESTVNWCPELGTVLANDEVKDGFSERGGFPVFQKKMKQWNLRITAYAERLLQGLEQIDFSSSLKEMQKNWIGKSTGAELDFSAEKTGQKLRVFTTRIDTIFGVSFIVMAPEHEWAMGLCTDKQKAAVEEYVDQTKRRSELDRMSDVKTVSGVFTGSYAINPFNEEKVPIYLADYVLAGYGTGIVMAVPAHDERDHRFAKHFGLPLKEVVAGGNVEEEAWPAKEGEIVNSGFISGLQVKEAQAKAIAFAEEKGVGNAKTQFKIRDASFSRQRFWGEPFPIYYKDGAPFLLEEESLPLELPNISEYKPTSEGKPPLARAENWVSNEGLPLDQNTMPGYAGSSWYFLRYMDPQNPDRFVGKEASSYWKDVDLYIGGTEHATGHLLYARFWTKFLKDMGHLDIEEPFKKLINQGMIQGRSSLVYRIAGTNTFVSQGLKDQHDTAAMHVDISLVNQNDELDMDGFKAWRPDLAKADFILEEGVYRCGHQVEKMSKRLYNTVDPNDMVEQYGADTFRMYEMFLGPLEDSKPWLTNGIGGVMRFIRKFWLMIHDKEGHFQVSDEEPTNAEYKTLYTCVQKISDDLERYSFNTCISAMMVCVNELSTAKANKRKIVEPLAVLFAPFAPHLASEVWEKLGHESFVIDAPWPEVKEQYLKEDKHEYPISINGKVRAKITFPLDMAKELIEEQVLQSDELQKWLDGKQVKKVIVVPKRIVNVVI